MRTPAIPCVLLFCAALGACDGDADSLQWISLAKDGQVEFVAGDRETQKVRFVEDSSGLWVRQVIDREDWSRALLEGRWEAAVLTNRLGTAEGGVSARLTADGVARDFDQGSTPSKGAPESFRHDGASLFLDLAVDEEPPSSAFFDQFLELRRQDADGTWRVHGRRNAGDGFALLSGESVRVRFQTQGETMLRAALALEPLLLEHARGEDTASSASNPERARVEFVILLDGEERVRKRLAVVPRGFSLPFELRILDSGPHVLEVRSSGALSVGSVLGPVVGPLALPPKAARPDVIVFVADTLRDDALRMTDSEGVSLTPHLDAFEAESVRFARAWTTGTHTLPAHGSILAGLMPPQAALFSHGDAISRSAVTLAEAFASRGYRTAAVTDSVVVSDQFGFAQGFATFSERKDSIEDTLSRVGSVLERDDGRPLFLFVHTYLMHSPYNPSEEARRLSASSLGLSEQDRFKDLELALSSAQAEHDQERMRAIGARLERMYRAQIVDLDRAFGRFRELLSSASHDDGVFVFLSDHGEAFGEHHEYWHAGLPFEEQARVPILLRAPGLEPALRHEQVSIVDIPGTLLDLVGLPRPEGWSSGSLLKPLEGRAVLTFRAFPPSIGDGAVAAVDWPWKVFLPETPEAITARDVRGAFSLDQDPGENENLVPESPAWIDRFLQRHQATMLEAFERRLSNRRSNLGALKAAELEALGYGGADG